MSNCLSVTQLVQVVNMSLQQIANVVVEGEVTEYNVIQNKFVTFKLKDEESTVGCFMLVWQLKTQIEDGMLVKASGTPKLRNQGFFSFVLQTVQPSGEGALKRAFELLQKKLEQEGLFAQERKRSLPKYPQHIALITSRDAAAYSDFITILTGRQGGLTVSFIHTQVQGEHAPQYIIEALETANTELVNLDAIVLVRGGGGLEDLQAFNDERVVRAVASSRTPIVVGVGHERDVTLAELAADVRASTPSNAAEILVRSRQELITDIRNLTTRFTVVMHTSVDSQASHVRHAVHVLQARIASTSSQVTRVIDLLMNARERFLQSIQHHNDRISHSTQTFTHTFHQHITTSTHHVAQLKRMLFSLSPQRTLKRGYSITRGVNGDVVKKSTQLSQEDVIVTSFHRGSAASTVNSVRQE